MKEETREERETRETREERVEAIEYARGEIRQTMQQLLQAEGGLSDAAFMLRNEGYKSREAVRRYVMDAQNACIGLCLVMNGWLQRENSEVAAAKNEAPK